MLQRYCITREDNGIVTCIKFKNILFTLCEWYAMETLSHFILNEVQNVNSLIILA